MLLYGIFCYTQVGDCYEMAKVTTYPGRRILADTVGDRMEAIRIAIGGSIRNQISQEALGELVGFDKYKISRLERGAQPLSRDDAIAIAKRDPLKRGPSWLMFGDEDDDEGEGNVEPAAPVPVVTPPSARPRPQIERVADASIYAKEIPRRPREKKITRRRKPDDRSARVG